MKHSAIILAFTLMITIACSNEAVETNQNTKEKKVGDSVTITIDLYVKKACGATEPTIALVKDLVDQMNMPSELNIIMLKSHRQAIERKIPGVPTIRVNGIDIDPAADQIQKYGIT